MLRTSDAEGISSGEPAALARGPLGLADFEDGPVPERVTLLMDLSEPAALDAQAERVVDQLRQDVKLTYFYQSQDQEGRRAKDMVAVLGRRNPHLHVRTIDPDKQPTVANTYGVRIYNAAVLETDGRKIQVLVRDTTGPNPEIAKRLAQELITRDKVDFLAGFGFTPEALAEYQAKLADARSESARIIEEARQSADKLRQDLRRQAEALEARIAEVTRLGGRHGVAADHRAARVDRGGYRRA